jgi:hypothetical protein
MFVWRSVGVPLLSDMLDKFPENIDLRRQEVEWVTSPKHMRRWSHELSLQPNIRGDEFIPHFFPSNQISHGTNSYLTWGMTPPHPSLTLNQMHPWSPRLLSGVGICFDLAGTSTRLLYMDHVRCMVEDSARIKRMACWSNFPLYDVHGFESSWLSDMSTACLWQSSCR